MEPGVPISTFFTETPGGPLIDAGVRSGDVNGDGLPDLVQAFDDLGFARNSQVFPLVQQKLIVNQLAQDVLLLVWPLGLPV